MTLKRESILKHAGVFTTQVVHVPAWKDETGDDSVLVRGMTVREFEVNQNSVGKDEGLSTAALVARCVVDENGSRLFEDKDIPMIAELGLAQIGEIAKAITDQSGITEPEAKSDEAKDEAEPGKSPTEAPNGSVPSAPTSGAFSTGSGSELRAISG